MAQNHSTLIEQVLERRRPLVSRLDAALQDLGRLSQSLTALEIEQGKLALNASDELKERLQNIDLRQLVQANSVQQQALQRLRTRFARPTLNLGVVGRARQGKSRLLQSFTGLSSREIPDGDRTHCTGVRSVIQHQSHGEPYAEVFFHDEASFLEEVIAPYYRGLPELGPMPRSLEDFAARQLPEPKERLLGVRGAQRSHLLRLHQNLANYRSLLTSGTRKTIPLSEVRQYVAQTSEDGNTAYTSHFAVRSVKVHCSFPRQDISKLSVVDMPGLGDTGIGDVERLVHTLGHEVDIVLFVRMPKTLGDHWADVDVELYDTAQSALPELSLSKWSFMVLNHTAKTAPQGDNGKNCQDLAEDIGRQGIEVTQTIVADCANAEGTHREILDPILAYTSENIQSLDQEFSRTCQNNLNKYLGEVKGTLSSAQKLFSDGLSDRENPLFRKLFEKTWEDLGSALEGYLHELQDHRDDEDPDFKRQLESALASCREDTGLPTATEVERRRHARGSYAIAYNELMHEVRTHLSRYFLQLDDGLKRSLLNVKLGVAKALSQDAGLKNLASQEGLGFLEEIYQLLPEETPNLKEGFELLLKFDLSYRGLIQHRIRRHLDGLTPDLSSLRLSAKPSADEVVEYLDTLHKEALYECEQALRGLLLEPSQAAFAMVEEYVDRVLRTKGARAEWDIFLHEVRAELWHGDFDRLAEKTRTRRSWQRAVEDAANYHSAPGFQFISLGNYHHA